jgi:Domain of unknown function (DUF4387)
MTARTVPLAELAAIVRSKNAGPFRLTLDVLFRTDEAYRRVVRARAITRESVAAAYGVKPEQVSSIFEVPAGRAIKVTLRRPRAQCEIGESDVYGCQQHAPLLALPVPDV